MIVIDKISSNSLFFIIPLLKFGVKIYYHEKKIKKDHKNLIPLTFKRTNQKSKNLYKKWNIGEQDYFKEYTSRYFKSKFDTYYNSLFKDVSDARDKIRAAFIRSLNFHVIGSININYEIFFRNKENNIVILHTSFHNYMCKENGSNFNVKLKHIYLPCDVLSAFLRLIRIKKLPNLIKLFRKNKYKKKFSPSNSSYQKKIALMIHESINYGKLYRKDHYFSDDKKSPLNINNVLIYTNNQSNNEKLDNNKELIKINKRVKINVIIQSLNFILLNFYKAKNIDELYGLLYSAFLFIKYKTWYEYFKDKNISNFIYDYDGLFSNSLAIALESLKIKTICFQERPVSSWWCNYGAIVDTYLIGGNLYKDNLNKNFTIISKNLINFGMWRISFFYKKDLIKLQDTKFSSYSSLSVNDFKKKILFLGYLSIPQDNYPTTCQAAFNDFLEYVIEVADSFPNSAIIIRLKALSNIDKNLVLRKIYGKKNIFLSIDYENFLVSYMLCKEADLIISVPTSLAEESIAYGKKVIFINNLFPINNISKDTYHPEFYFCIPENLEEIKVLINRCFNNDLDILIKYQTLKKLLSGSVDFSKPNIISKKLEEICH